MMRIYLRFRICQVICIVHRRKKIVSVMLGHTGTGGQYRESM